MLSVAKSSVCNRAKCPAPAPPRLSRKMVVPVRAQAGLVTVEFNGRREALKLINNKIHLDTVKQLFNLQSVRLNGIIEPVGNDGLTIAPFEADDTPIVVTGHAARDLALLCNEMSGLRDEVKQMYGLRSDVMAIKRLVAEITWKTVSSQDEGQQSSGEAACDSSKASTDLARDIINESTRVDKRAPSPMDDLIAGMHAH